MSIAYTMLTWNIILVVLGNACEADDKDLAN